MKDVFQLPRSQKPLHGGGRPRGARRSKSQAERAEQLGLVVLRLDDPQGVGAEVGCEEPPDFGDMEQESIGEQADNVMGCAVGFSVRAEPERAEPLSGTGGVRG